MSIFPGRSTAGGTIIIHSRRNHVSSGEVEPTRVSIFGPDGKVKVVDERALLVLPRPPRASGGRSKELLQEVFRVTPAAVFAEYLAQYEHEPQYFLEFFRDLGRSLNWYTCFHVPEDAEPGRYEVRLEMSVRGQVLGSATRSLDHFYIDEIEVGDMTRRRGGYRVAVRNLSPEETPIRVWEVSTDGREGLGCTYEEVRLKGGQVSMIPTRSSKCFVSYWHETAPIGVSFGGEPFVVRHPELLFHDDVENARVCVSRGRGGDTLMLKGDAREIFVGASGLRVRSELRGRNARTYDWLLRRGLIAERATRETAARRGGGSRSRSRGTSRR